MKIIELKNKFYQEIRNRYEKTEVESFFYLLTEAFIGLKRVDLALNPYLELSPETEQIFDSAIAKLKKHIPIQYIIGSTEFFGLHFKVNKNVLIPRLETEELVQWIIEEVKSDPHSKTIKILDIGTGSGCIPISLAKNLHNTRVWALDISKEALRTAQNNAVLNEADIIFIEKDILKTTELKTKFDIIVSNPPYVRDLEKKQMQKNVLAHEPHLALFVKDKDPLLFYDTIASFAYNNLHSGGKLFVEINQAFGKETIQLLKNRNFKNIELKKDIFGADRMIRCEIN